MAGNGFRIGGASERRDVEKFGDATIDDRDRVPRALCRVGGGDDRFANDIEDAIDGESHGVVADVTNDDRQFGPGVVGAIMGRRASSQSIGRSRGVGATERRERLRDVEQAEDAAAVLHDGLAAEQFDLLSRNRLDARHERKG